MPPNNLNTPPVGTPAPQSYQQMPPNAPQSQPAPPKKRRLWLIIIVIFVVLIGLMIVGRLLPHPDNQTSTGTNAADHGSAETSQIQKLGSNASNLQASDLASFNKDDLFFGVFRKAAEQPSLTMTQSFAQAADINAQPQGDPNFYQTGYNYSTKQYAFETSVQHAGTGDVEITRCSKGHAYNYSSLFAENGWKQQTGPAADDDCTPTNNPWLNDGINTGGLTASQANTFANTLRSYSGLVSVDKVGLMTQNGKRYIRFDVTINRIADAGVYSGLGFFDKAFGMLNLGSDHPYMTGGALSSGAKMAYVVDPATQLPIYNQTVYMPANGGQPGPSNPIDIKHMTYDFGAVPSYGLTMSAPDITPIKMDWPNLTL